MVPWASLFTLAAFELTITSSAFSEDGRDYIEKKNVEQYRVVQPVVGEGKIHSSHPGS